LLLGDLDVDVCHVERLDLTDEALESIPVNGRPVGRATS
jgi:hypothetical protein